MIVLSPVAYSADYGSLVIREDPESKLAERTARISRTATLDGGCLLVHGGVSAGDRTLNVKATDISEADVTTLKALFSGLTLLVISCKEGCYEGSIEQLRTDHGDVNFTFLVRDDLTV